MHCALAEPLATAGRRPEALAAARAGLEIAERFDSSGTSMELRLYLSMCRWQVAKMRHVLGEDDVAAELLRAEVANLGRMIAERPSFITPYVGTVAVLDTLATILPAERCTHLGRALAVWRSWPEAPTTYTRRREDELKVALDGCPSSR